MHHFKNDRMSLFQMDANILASYIIWFKSEQKTLVSMRAYFYPTSIMMLCSHGTNLWEHAT